MKTGRLGAEALRWICYPGPAGLECRLAGGPPFQPHNRVGWNHEDGKRGEFPVSFRKEDDWWGVRECASPFPQRGLSLSSAGAAPHLGGLGLFAGFAANHVTETSLLSQSGDKSPQSKACARPLRGFGAGRRARGFRCRRAVVSLKRKRVKPAAAYPPPFSLTLHPSPAGAAGGNGADFYVHRKLRQERRGRQGRRPVISWSWRSLTMWSAGRAPPRQTVPP